MYKSTCTPVFIAALFTISRTWKQPRCPMTDKWIKKLWYIYTMEYHSAIKKEHIWVSSNEVDEPRAYYTKWSRSEVQFSHWVVSDSLWVQHTRPPCPSATLRTYSNSCPSSQWCHPTISYSVVPFSSYLQSFPASGSFLVRQFFASGGKSIGISASASVLPKNIQDPFHLGWTGWISLQSKGLSRVFSNTTIQKCQFFSSQFSLQCNFHIHTWLLEKP